MAPGADAGLVLWAPKKKARPTNAMAQYAIDHTPHERHEVNGWPVMTIPRGHVVMRDRAIDAAPGEGKYLARGPHELIRPPGVVPDGFDTARIGAWYRRPQGPSLPPQRSSRASHSPWERVGVPPSPLGRGSG